MTAAQICTATTFLGFPIFPLVNSGMPAMKKKQHKNILCIVLLAQNCLPKSGIFFCSSFHFLIHSSLAMYFYSDHHLCSFALDFSLLLVSLLIFLTLAFICLFSLVFHLFFCSPSSYFLSQREFFSLLRVHKLDENIFLSSKCFLSNMSTCLCCYLFARLSFLVTLFFGPL